MVADLYWMLTSSVYHVSADALQPRVYMSLELEVRLSFDPACVTMFEPMLHCCDRRCAGREPKSRININAHMGTIIECSRLAKSEAPALMTARPGPTPSPDSMTQPHRPVLRLCACIQRAMSHCSLDKGTCLTAVVRAHLLAQIRCCTPAPTLSPR